MPRGLRLALTLLFIVAAMPVARAAAPDKPAIRLSQEEWNFGEVKAGARLYRTIELTNQGTAPLLIGPIRAVCGGCLVGIVSANPIPPGGAARLVLMYEVEDKPGEVSSAVVIHSNDPAQPFKKIAVKGTIATPEGKARLKVTPERFDLGMLVPGVVVAREVTLANTGKENLRIGALVTSRHCLVDGYGNGPAASIPAGGQLKLICYLKLDGLQGAVTEHLAFTSNDPFQPAVVVPLTGFVPAEAAGKDASAGPAAEVRFAFQRSPGESEAWPVATITSRLAFPLQVGALAGGAFRSSTPAQTLSPGGTVTVRLVSAAKAGDKAQERGFLVLGLLDSAVPGSGTAVQAK